MFFLFDFSISKTLFYKCKLSLVSLNWRRRRGGGQDDDSRSFELWGRQRDLYLVLPLPFTPGSRPFENGSRLFVLFLLQNITKYFSISPVPATLGITLFARLRNPPRPLFSPAPAPCSPPLNSSKFPNFVRQGTGATITFMLLNGVF